MPLQPQPAATVVLIREGRDGPEVLLVRRNPALVFAGGAHVFPGGRVDAADHAPLPGCVIDDTAVSERLGLARGGLAFLQAALRECFEEAGILLAEYPDGTALPPAGLDRLRHALRNGRADLPALLTGAGLVATVERLRYLARWITPPGLPRRFDTRFFLAPAPVGQEVLICGEETVDACWITPAQALRAGERGRMQLLGPTRRTLSTLTGHDSLSTLLDHLDTREVAAAPTI